MIKRKDRLAENQVMSNPIPFAEAIDYFPNQFEEFTS